MPKTHLNYPIYASISGNHAEFSENVRRMREIIFGPDDPRAKSDHLTRNDLAEVKRMLALISFPICTGRLGPFIFINETILSFT